MEGSPAAGAIGDEGGRVLMPVSKEHAKGLVTRLCTLPSQDLSDLVEAQAIRDELGRAIIRHCSSDDHATSVVDKLIDSRFRPTPGDIKEAAETVSGGMSTLNPVDPNCKICNGGGFRIIERDGLTAAAVCSCRKK